MRQFKEYVITSHWQDRVTERVANIADISYPSEIFEGVVNKDELKTALDDRIKKIIRSRLAAYQAGQDQDPSKYYSTLIVSIQLRKGGKTYIPTIKTSSTVGSTDESKGYDGNTYVGMSHKNTLYTLINIPQDKIDPHYLAQKTIQNMKTKGLHLTEDDVEVVFATNYIATLDVDATINQLAAAKSGPMGVPKTPEDLPYKVKKDYVKSSPGRPNFITHKDFGRGEILSSEQGMGGKWENVIVKFPSGNKTFRTLYSSSFFLK
jgi:hypothetical protein